MSSLVSNLQDWGVYIPIQGCHMLQFAPTTQLEGHLCTSWWVDSKPFGEHLCHGGLGRTPADLLEYAADLR